MSGQATRRGWSERATLLALGLWGAIHVIGGASLIAASTTEGLDTLAPDAPTTQRPQSRATQPTRCPDSTPSTSSSADLPC